MNSREYSNMPSEEVHRQWFQARKRKPWPLMWYRRNQWLSGYLGIGAWYTLVACAAVFLVLAMPWQMSLAFAILLVEAKR